MFTTGQLIFALLFFVSFVIFATFSYRKDRKLHAREYKGAKWVLVGFIGFIILLFIIKYTLKP